MNEGVHGDRHVAEKRRARPRSHPSVAPREAALLVGLVLPGTPAWEAEDSLDELGRLAETAMLAVAGRVLQAQPRIGATYYIGKGKAHELEERAHGCGASVIVFDNDLSPAQMRNLERLSGLRVLDRSAVVLDIFARHARTRTAMVQVELAQLEYLLPRLTRQWTHLSRQAGGGAIRGMGGPACAVPARRSSRSTAALSGTASAACGASSAVSARGWRPRARGAAIACVSPSWDTPTPASPP